MTNSNSKWLRTGLVLGVAGTAFVFWLFRRNRITIDWNGLKLTGEPADASADPVTFKLNDELWANAIEKADEIITKPRRTHHTARYARKRQAQRRALAKVPSGSIPHLGFVPKP